MIDGMFVFDCVIHQYDLSEQNLRKDVAHARHGHKHMASFSGLIPVLGGPDIDHARRVPTEDMYDMVFNQSPTDMAMAQVVPIFEWFHDWFAPVQAQYELARAYPDQVLFCGGVDPLYRGMQDALDQIEHQVRGMGARSIKFYNGHVESSWRCDDDKVAYPLYQKCLDVGVDVIQFHKGSPFGMQNVEDLAPNDLQRAARDFPQMKFIIHHLALPYFRETVSIASRFDNIYLALSGILPMYILQPRRFLHMLGTLMQEVGSDKLLWGSEAALAGSPAPYLKAFMDMQMPESLRSGYGYPEITCADREKILGLNFASIIGVDIEAKKRELAREEA